MSDALYDDGNLVLHEHGMTIRRYWLPLDLRRPSKHTLLCGDSGREIAPAYAHA